MIARWWPFLVVSTFAGGAGPSEAPPALPGPPPGLRVTVALRAINCPHDCADQDPCTVTDFCRTWSEAAATGLPPGCWHIPAGCP